MLDVAGAAVAMWLVAVAVLLLAPASVSANIMVFNNSSGHQVEVEFRDMPARFGDPIAPDGIEAYIVYADPPNACSKLKPPPRAEFPTTKKWAVLIKRFNCSFEYKVRAAQNATYDVAIVHNVGSSELEPMSAENPYGIVIPALFVGDLTGRLLKENYQYTNHYFVEINNESPFDINTHLLLPFAIVVGLCIFVMLGFMVGMVIKCIKDQRRARRHRLPASSLRKIPTAKFHKGDPYETCAICLEDYAEGDKLRVLPCSHAYHSKCVDPWLTCNRRVCPVCKRKVFAADEPHPGSNTDSDSDADMMDDTTPLMLPSRQTQGGTFTSPFENPLRRSPGGPLWRHDSLSSISTNSNGSDEDRGPTFYIIANRPEVAANAGFTHSPHDADGEGDDEDEEVSDAAKLLRTSRRCRRREENNIPRIAINSGNGQEIATDASDSTTFNSSSSQVL